MNNRYAGVSTLMKQRCTAGWYAAIIFILTLGISASQAVAIECDAAIQMLTKQIPQRSAQTLTGSQFVNLLTTIGTTRREQAIGEQLLQGNIPDFLRQLKPVTLKQRDRNGRLVQATIFVTPDYLAIGSQDDFIRMPMDFHTASKVAKSLGFILPTRRMVDAIYDQSENHFTPQPLPPGPQMCSTRYYQRHNQKIHSQRQAHGIALGTLVSGHKKDIVISNRLLRKPGRIAIYGWHRSNGSPIQPLSTIHGAGYADYSHGVRLVSNQVLVDGKLRSVYDILQDPNLASLLSDEGPMLGLHAAPQQPIMSAHRFIPGNRF